MNRKIIFFIGVITISLNADINISQSNNNVSNDDGFNKIQFEKNKMIILNTLIDYKKILEKTENCVRNSNSVEEVKGCKVVSKTSKKNLRKERKTERQTFRHERKNELRRHKKEQKQKIKNKVYSLKQKKEYSI